MTSDFASESPIRRGLKIVAVGKKGSRNLTPELAVEILAEIQDDTAPPVAVGALIGALQIKGLSPEEDILSTLFAPGIWEQPALMLEALAPRAPSRIKELCARMLAGHTLDVAQARQLGDFLMRDEDEGEVLRGLAAAILRVRYETADEYDGLLRSIHDTFHDGFRTPVPEGEPVLQVAEPFDGVDHSYMMTPLVMRELQQQRWRVVGVCGRNSGPKFGNNLYDLAQGLGLTFLESNAGLSAPKPEFGWYLAQDHLSAATDRWVDRRHALIKRPFLATVERFVNPCGASLLIASAFHPPYGEKMLTAGERVGFPGIIIVRNGMEGTTGFPLKRCAKILCSARQPDGSFRRTEFDFDAAAFLGAEPDTEERMEAPSLKENLRLIRQFAQEGQTDNQRFDWRVRATVAGLQQGITWIKSGK